MPTVGRGGASRVTPAQALGRFSTIRTKADMHARDPAVYDRAQFTGGAPTCAPSSCVTYMGVATCVLAVYGDV